MALTTVQNGMIGVVNSLTASNGDVYGGLYGFRNRIINGAMVIDQRNAGASVTATNFGYTLDRWQASSTQSSKMTVQQSTTAPAGFKNSLLVTSSSAYSVVSSDRFSIQQYIEGLNCTDLSWGTANAQTVTLSFWVRSSLTGTFGGSITNAGGAYRDYPFSYTISSANTFEYKTITIAGDTSGTWLTTNGIGLMLTFGLGIGSTYTGTANAWASSEIYSPPGATSIIATNGATFYITGCQLEKGSTATSFDYRPYGTELALCQRYFYKNAPASANGCGMGFGMQTGTQNAAVLLNLLVPMRSAPTLVQADTIISDNTTFDATVTSLDGGYFTTTSGYANFGFSAAGSTNRPVLFRAKSSGNIGSISFSSEL